MRRKIELFSMNYIANCSRKILHGRTVFKTYIERNILYRESIALYTEHLNNYFAYYSIISRLDSSFLLAISKN